MDRFPERRYFLKNRNNKKYLLVLFLLLGLVAFFSRFFADEERILRWDADNADVLVVGCGLSGAVLARLYADVFDKRVLIVEKRAHIGSLALSLKKCPFS